MASQIKRTTNHIRIKEWAKKRNAKPSVIRDEGETTGLIQFDFPGYAKQNLQEISWEQWFDFFEENKLELAYQEHTEEGHRSNFNKLVDRNN